MNKVYRLIWNDTKSTWDIAPETARARGKRSGGSVTSKVATVTGFILKPIALSFALLGIAHAAPGINELPTGGQLSAGTASISQTTNIMTINQSTNRAAVNWNTFNVGAQATININQPTSSSVLLNRVNAANPSQIFGQINANGQVFLTNPSGIHFAPGSSLNVGGLVATTHSISDTDFMAGNDVFNRDGATGSILNEGDLTAALNGYIALLAPEVRNEGVIIAQLGTVALAAGEAFELQFDSNNTLANIRIEPATIDALVENGNAVHAPSGLIILSAQAINTLQGGVVNNTGSLEATGLTNNGGVIRLEASDTITHTGSINVDAAANSTGNGGSATIIANLDNPNSRTVVNGSLSAKAGNLGGNGGFIETSASNLNIGDNTQVTTQANNGENGTWLLDPTNIIIASGGVETLTATTHPTPAKTTTLLATAGDVTISASTIEDALKVTHVTLEATNDITINEALSNNLTNNNTLTLTADADTDGTGDINVNAVVTIGDGDGITLNYGGDLTMAKTAAGVFTGKIDLDSSSVVNINSNTFTVVSANDIVNTTALSNLEGMTADGSNQYYILGTDIDASATAGGAYNAGAGFNPVGNSLANRFQGTFEGFGHTISDLTINRSGTTYVGLFGTGYNINISNVILKDAVIDGQNDVGAFVGRVAYYGGTSSFKNIASINGDITGDYSVGGLIGVSENHTTISDSMMSGVVKGSGDHIGGLAGSVFTAANNPTLSITNSYATGDVTWSLGATTDDSHGGLVGYAKVLTGTISDSYYTTGTLTGNHYVGGLLGNDANKLVTITDSYNTGNISGVSWVGGLAGSIQDVVQSYSTGNISATGERIGGIAGIAKNITQSYSTGDVATTKTAVTEVGGLVGTMLAGGTIANSYSLSNVTSAGYNVGGLAGNTSGGTISDSYYAGIMSAVGGSQIGAINGTGGGTITNSFWDNDIYANAVEDGDGGIGKTTTQMKTNLTFTDAGWDFVGETTNGTNDIWNMGASSNNGYACLWGVGCSATNVYARLITGSSTFGTAPSFTYGYYTTASGSTTISDATPSGTVTWTGAPTSASNAGTYSMNYSSGITLGNSFYSLLAGDAVNWTVDKAPLTITASADSKTYDGLAYSGGNGATYSGFVNSETSTALGGTLAYAGASQSATAAGTYAITPNGYTSDNYTFSYVDGVLTILPKPVSKSVLIEVPLQLEQRAEAVQVRTNTTITQPENKILTISGSVITVSLESMPNTGQNGIIVVNVPRDNATSGEGFSFSLPKQLNEMAQKTNTPAKVTMTSGEALPTWLEFDAETMSVKSGAVPTGAYPIEVSVSVGSDTFIVVISEKATE